MVLEFGLGEVRAKRKASGVVTLLNVLDIGLSTCIRLNGGGSKCREKCQGIVASETNKCYCTGSCERSSLGLTCYCKNPSCPCGPSWG
jgi:hypothetical protein